MRRALTSAAKALVAAGALGLVSPVLAQSTQAIVKSGPATPLVKPETAAPSQAAMDEMQVELAWLESPLTFHLDLVVHVADHKLEVSGCVPNEDVKEAALRFASRHTSLPISDLVTINPGIVSPVSKVAADVLTARAKESLGDLCDRIVGLKISARDDGQVTIRGVVKSLEEKLKVSRRLRQVDGYAATHFPPDYRRQRQKHPPALCDCWSRNYQRLVDRKAIGCCQDQCNKQGWLHVRRLDKSESRSNDG
jgi:hypothetical protein